MYQGHMWLHDYMKSQNERALVAQITIVSLVFFVDMTCIYGT